MRALFYEGEIKSVLRARPSDWGFGKAYGYALQ